ncbi:hypothetical protein EDC01DRAFT_226688 [Geopyxis carbonaria]|nr:hypothetical protein EDC01DRAFT_226688 [Geopyxis carbonaria]
MWDCRTSAGHFFVHSPQIRTFVCHRCRKVSNHYNPPQPRLGSKVPFIPRLNPDQPKAPWRCILENCAYTLCFPCVEHVDSELAKIRALKEEADSLGEPYDIEEAVKQAEACEGASDELPKMPWQKSGTVRNRAGSLTSEGGLGGGVVNPHDHSVMEVDTGPIEVDDGSDGEYNMDDLALPRLSYRSATMAAAASVRAQSGSRRRVPLIRQERLSMESQKPTKAQKIATEGGSAIKEPVDPQSDIVADNKIIEVDSESSEGDDSKCELPRMAYRRADLAAARLNASRIAKRSQGGSLRPGERR